MTLKRDWQSDPDDLHNRLCDQIAAKDAEIERLKADNAKLQKQKDYWKTLAIDRAL